MDPLGSIWIPKTSAEKYGDQVAMRAAKAYFITFGALFVLSGTLALAHIPFAKYLISADLASLPVAGVALTLTQHVAEKRFEKYQDSSKVV